MSQKKIRKTNRKLVLIIATFGIIALSLIAVVSVKMVAKQNTTPTAAHADSRTSFNLNSSFGDAFKDDQVNTNKWNISKVADVTINESKADNLNIIIPAGSNNNKPKSGGVTFKQAIGDSDDFAMNVELYKPIATGGGAGVSGIVFSSSDSNDDESVRVQWLADGSTSKLMMVIKAADGTTLESKSVDVQAAKLVLRLARNKDTYTANYKIGTNDDTEMILIDSKSNPSLGAAGKVRIFASNTGKDNKFPKVISRIDNVNIGWFDPSIPDSNRVVINDKFNDGKISTDMWVENKTAGANIVENVSDNLVMNLGEGSENGKVKTAFLTSKTSIPKQRDFQLVAQLIKPAITGEGTIRAGVQYLTNGSANDERAAIIWEVSKNGSDSASKLIFITTKSNGTVSFKKDVELKNEIGRATLRISRTDKGYVAMYKNGVNDSDVQWITIGVAPIISNSLDGKAQLFSSNLGLNKKFPGILGRFDYFNLSYLK